jgi:hypothetical protein
MELFISVSAPANYAAWRKLIELRTKGSSRFIWADLMADITAHNCAPRNWDQVRRVVK